MREVLKIEGLTKIYKNNKNNAEILNGIDLTIYQGEIVSLFGPSGCGKTTLLRCIAGLEPVSAGKVIINQTDYTSVSPNRRPVVMMFQQPLLFPHLNVIQNVTYGLKQKKVKKKERVLEGQKLLQRMEMSDYAYYYPYELSGGQQQRVALARALALKPSVLLLDEPFSSLNPDLRVNLREWVCQMLKEHRVTTLFVTHDKEEAMIMGDKMIVMADGSIQQVGTPEQIYHHPVNAIVAHKFSDGVMTTDHTFIPAHQLILKKSDSQNSPTDEGIQAFAGTITGSVLKYGQRFYQVSCTKFLHHVFIHSHERLEVGESVQVIYLKS